MFRAKTCLVVGAGASAEAGFPVGAGLLSAIKSRLNLKYDLGNYLSEGDSVIAQNLLARTGGFNDEFQAGFRAARRISEAASIALSIDNILEQHSHDPLVQELGKVAIVRSILEAERKSRLFVSGRPAQSAEPLMGTWFESTAKMLCENVSRTNLDRVFDNLSIITFNYDRSIECYLPLTLSTTYGIHYTQASQLVEEQLEIVHPYGMVAPFPQAGKSGVNYGQVDGVNLFEYAKGILTFSERIDDPELLESVRKPIREAEQVLFLGFGFHRQNVQLIVSEASQVRRIYASVKGIHLNDRDVVVNELSPYFPTALARHALRLVDGTCQEMMSQNWRGITAHA